MNRQEFQALIKNKPIFLDGAKKRECPPEYARNSGFWNTGIL